MLVSGPRKRARPQFVKPVAPDGTGWGTHKTKDGAVLDPRSRFSLPRIVHDRRYGLKRWQKLRLRILNRDNWVCRIVVGCTTRATIADHIIPVYPGMPDREFFDPNNLRAACRDHNLARAAAAKLEPAASVETKDYT
jgi:5-methylcytosine-specific restriction endonuclease McrA